MADDVKSYNVVVCVTALCIVLDRKVVKPCLTNTASAVLKQHNTWNPISMVHVWRMTVKKARASKPEDVVLTHLPLCPSWDFEHTAVSEMVLYTK